MSKQERAYRRERALRELERKTPISGGQPGFFYSDPRYLNDHMPGVYVLRRPATGDAT